MPCMSKGVSEKKLAKLIASVANYCWVKTGRLANKRIHIRFRR